MRARGFTLMELMVVVLLVALLATLASPAFSQARNDRTAFDYARQYQQVITRARARAAGTGSAHLIVLGPGSGDKRGFIRSYYALDGEPKAPLNLVGPNPVSSCKQDPAQWVDATKDPVVVEGTMARFLDFADLNRLGTNKDMDLKAVLSGTGLNLAVAGTLEYIVICISPSGVTYAGGGADAPAAVTAMQTAPPFTGVAEVTIRRHEGGTGIGIKRRVLISGAATPRIKSE